MRLKKFISSCILMIMLACTFMACLAVAGCNNNNDNSNSDENKKYDVTIKIKNNLGSEWIFTPDIKELYYEFEYTGRQMKFYLDSYNLPDHPRWSNEWFNPTGEGANVFSTSYLYTDLDGKQSEPRAVLEKGDYVFSCSARATSDLWKFRTVHLFITVI